MPFHLLPIWVQLTCGGCRKQFVGNARTVPQWKGSSACPACWRQINEARARMSLSTWDTPVDAYPDGRVEWRSDSI
jgi:hypothetical protein